MISAVVEFVSEQALWLALASAVSLVIASLLAPRLVAQLPADYFAAERRNPVDRTHWSVRWSLIIVKNAVGVILIAAGLIMLFTPGQGLLTLLAGLLLANFPGKYRLERYLAHQPRFMSMLNRMRVRRGAHPFQSPD